MKAWLLAVLFGVAGGVLGSSVAFGSGVSGQQPIWTLVGVGLFALLGAVLGGVSDIVDAIKRKG